MKAPLNYKPKDCNYLYEKSEGLYFILKIFLSIFPNSLHKYFYVSQMMKMMVYHFRKFFN